MLQAVEEDGGEGVPSARETADTFDDGDGDLSEDEDMECYHEIHAIPLLDPVLDKQV